MDTKHPRAKSDINITPLIDIVLVLLIVFIVMVPGLSKALAVNVPKVVEGPKSDEIPVVVSMDKDGKLYLQREEIAISSLSERLVPPVMLQTFGQRKIFLKMDGELPQAQAVRILDEIRVASEKVKAQTKAKPGFQDEDGGEIKVAITLLKPGQVA